MTIPSNRESSNACREVTIAPRRSVTPALIPAICDSVRSIPFSDVWENSVSVRLQVSKIKTGALQSLNIPFWKSQPVKRTVRILVNEKLMYRQLQLRMLT